MHGETIKKKTNKTSCGLTYFAFLSHCYIHNRDASTEVLGITLQKTTTVTVSVLISFSRARLGLVRAYDTCFVCAVLETADCGTEFKARETLCKWICVAPSCEWKKNVQVVVMC